MQTSQFCKPAHAADAGVAGVCDLADIIHHLMAVIRAEGDEMINLLGRFVNGFHRRVHIDISIEMIGLVKIALTVLFYIPEVNEMNSRAHFCKDRWNVVLRIRAQRTAADTEAIRRRRGVRGDVTQILDRRDYSR